MFEPDLEGLMEPFTGNERFAQWCDSLATTCKTRTTESTHAGLWNQWHRLLEDLPNANAGVLDVSHDVIAVRPSSKAESFTESDLATFRNTLLSLCPWRVGPWDFFGVDMQAEWDSSKKWHRIAPAVYFNNAKVLDVGCNSGYFGWRSLAAGARCVVGCDPFLLYNVQHQLFRQYSADKHRHHVLPIGDDDVPQGLGAFDVALSLGVLIHRSSPINHLLRLHSTLRKRGQLVLETMAIDALEEELLVPEDRFLKMRGIWFVPSIGMLKRWLQRTGFEDIEIIDVSSTLSDEQRRTEFMPFESLADFLDPNDASKTIEGYPKPVRVAITAVRGQ